MDGDEHEASLPSKVAAAPAKRPATRGAKVSADQDEVDGNSESNTAPAKPLTKAQKQALAKRQMNQKKAAERRRLADAQTKLDKLAAKAAKKKEAEEEQGAPAKATEKSPKNASKPVALNKNAQCDTISYL
jgi:hypothetical protein